MQDWIPQSDSALRFGARVMLVGSASLARRCPRFWALIVLFIFTLPIYAQPNAETSAVGNWRDRASAKGPNGDCSAAGQEWQSGQSCDQPVAGRVFTNL